MAPAFEIPPFSTDPVIEAENVRLHTIHDAGYEANFAGVLLQQNPHPPLSIEFSAWESGHLAANSAREDWEADNDERARNEERADHYGVAA